LAIRRALLYQVPAREAFRLIMVRPELDDEEEKPLDPAVERVRRKLVRFVAVNLGILLVALMAVGAALVYKSRGGREPAAIGGEGGIAAATIPLPAGARIVSQSLSGDRLSIDAELAGGERAIFLYDLAQRRLIGRFAIGSE
jgi:hypothetical protein